MSTLLAIRPTDAPDVGLRLVAAIPADRHPVRWYLSSLSPASRRPMLHGLEASIEGSCHFDKSDLGMLLDFISRGEIRVEPLVTHCVPIDEAPAIYETLRDRPGELLGVIFDWTT